MVERKVDKERLKVVVRLLPPGLSEEAFLKTVDSGTKDAAIWSRYVAGQIKQGVRKEGVCSRAYFLLPTQAGYNFISSYHGHSFRDEKGETFRAVVVPAPYQRISEDQKPDKKAGTMESDKVYKAWIKKWEEDNDETKREEREKAHMEANQKEVDEEWSNVTITPLVAYMNKKRAERGPSNTTFGEIGRKLTRKERRREKQKLSRMGYESSSGPPSTPPLSARGDRGNVDKMQDSDKKMERKRKRNRERKRKKKEKKEQDGREWTEAEWAAWEKDGWKDDEEWWDEDKGSKKKKKNKDTADENWGAKGEGEGGETRKERRRRRRKERAAKVTAEGSGATGGADGDVKKDGEKKGRSEREKERKKERRREKRRQEKVDREAAKAAGLPAQPSKDQRGGRDRKRDRKKNKEDGGGAAGATAAAAPVASSNATATPAKSGSGQGTSATPGKVVGTWRPKIKKRDA